MATRQMLRAGAGNFETGAAGTRSTPLAHARRIALKQVLIR